MASGAGGAWTVPSLIRQLPSSAQTGNRLCCALTCSTSNSPALASSFRGRAAGRLLAARNRNFPVVGRRGRARAASQEASTSTLLVQEVEFIWNGQESEVLLTGDFLKWETKVALEKRSNGVFSIKQKLAVGRYSYKFVVDGEWKHSPDSATVPDGRGGLNNEIVVTDLTSNDATNDFKDAPESQVSQPTNSLEKPAVSTKPAEESSGLEKPEATTKPGKENDGLETPVASAKPAKENDGLEKPVVSIKPAKGNDAPEKPAASAKPGKEMDGAAKPTPKAAPKKAVAKSLEETMLDDVIPLLTSTLETEAGITDLDVTFQENQLKTSFAKGDIPYCFWAFFPDGTVEGSRGSSLTSHGSPPSTIEPFLIDEKKITPELIVFWIKKRLFAQNLLSMN